MMHSGEYLVLWMKVSNVHVLYFQSSLEFPLSRFTTQPTLTDQLLVWLCSVSGVKQCEWVFPLCKVGGLPVVSWKDYTLLCVLNHFIPWLTTANVLNSVSVRVETPLSVLTVVLLSLFAEVWTSETFVAKVMGGNASCRNFFIVSVLLQFCMTSTRKKSAT